MHPEMPLLLALHEIDARLILLDRTLRKLDNGDAARAALSAAKGDLTRAEDGLRQSRVALGVAEAALKSNESEQAKKNKQLYGGSVVNAREAEAVGHEIAALKVSAGDIETQILEAMDAIEAGEKAVAAYRQSLAARESELATIVAQYEAASGELKAQAAETMSKRPAAAAPISAAVMARYDAARKRTKDTGLAILVGQTCEGCHMQVPGVSILQLRNNPEVVNCDNCGRILFFKG